MAKQKTIVVIVAHPLEAKELENELQSEPFEIAPNGDFLLDNLWVRLIISGVGKKEVESCLKHLFKNNERISAVINVGFAGALDDGIKSEEWVLAEHIYYFDNHKLRRESYPAHPGLMETARHYFGLIKTPYRTGSLVTVNNPYSEKADKESLFKKTKRAIVDMEAYLISAAATNNDIPFISIKVISDALADKVEDAIKARGKNLSHQIARIIPGLIMKVAGVD